MVEPFDAYKHGSVPRLPETDDPTDVRYVTSGRDKHRTLTDLPQTNLYIQYTRFMHGRFYVGAGGSTCSSDSLVAPSSLAPKIQKLAGKNFPAI